VIGGYGWGKSTLALVAAQLLGLPASEEGHRAVVTALDPESGDAPRQLVDKVKSRKPKFTICIKGANRDFHELFVAAVAASKRRYAPLLEEHGLALQIKSEYDSALEMLRNLGDAPGYTAILQEEQISQSALLSGLATLDPEILARADRIWQRFNRVSADVRPVWYQKSDTARYLGELVEAVTSPPASPFDGVLVLFDELGLWLAYANENENRAGGPAFLAFMEAAQRYRNRLTVCSFIQYDVEAFVGRDTASSNVKHMSERLGVRIRYQPDLERVFLAAIKQAREGRREIWARHEPDFELLTDQLVRMFEDYRKGTWSGIGRVKDILVKRSWPIHPFMVAAVCHLRFGQGYRVIQILEDQFPKLDEKLIENDKGELTWSVPVDVVDFYRPNFENLHAADGERKLWDRYAFARESLRSAADDKTSNCLKAVFLVHALAGNIRISGRDEFIELISLFANVSEEDVENILDRLSSSQGAAVPILLGNDATGWYEFFSAEQNPAEAREYVNKRYEEASSFEFGWVIDYFKPASLSPSVFAQRRHLQVHGYQQMYEAVIDVNNVNANYLARLCSEKVLSETDPDYRGVHLIVLYGDDKKPSALPSPNKSLPERVRELCQEALNKTWEDLKSKHEEVPICLSIPNDTPNDLYRSLGLLRSARFMPPDEKKRLGAGLAAFIEMETRRLERIVPAWANPSKLSLIVPDESVDDRLASVRRVGNKAEMVGSFFQAVFPFTPPLNYSALGNRGTGYTRYIWSLVEFLLNPLRQRRMPQEHSNALDSVLLSNNGLADRNWMAVTETTSGFTVVPPQNSLALRCFDDFDAEVRKPALGVPVQFRALWRKFSRAPYGLDIRSFLLLFGVWYATHRDECVLRSDSGDFSWENIVKACEKRADIFSLVSSSDLTLQLRDVAAEVDRLNKLLAKMAAWAPGDSTAEQLLKEAADAKGIALGSPDWAQVSQEVLRITQQVEQQSQQLQFARELNADIMRNCRLENITDYARRVATLAVSATSSSVREALAKCLDAMLNRAREAAGAVIKSSYSSADIERHEVERARDFVTACAFTELARTVDEGILEPVEQAVADILGALNDALSSVSERHEAKRLAYERAENFRGRLEEGRLNTNDPEASLGTLSRALSDVVSLERECPSELRQEFVRVRTAVERRRNEVSKAISTWLGSFAQPLTPDAVKEQLLAASQIVKLAHGSEFEVATNQIIKAADLLTSGAELYSGALRSLSAGPDEAEGAVADLASLQDNLPQELRVQLTNWQADLVETISQRRKATEQKAIALERSLKGVRSPETVLRAVDDINAFVREVGAWAPEAVESLLQELQRTLCESVPAQIAALLRPIPQTDRTAVVEKALALLVPQE
jgi:hypothetical protein